ncbi:MAG: histidine phosphatase family protein, partial [bacterium]
MTTVLLVRHGRTASNASGTLAGRTPGLVLDEKGVEQAARAAERIAAVRLDAIVSSPLERTVETAQAILAGQAAAPGRRRASRKAEEIHRDDRFIECDYGAWTGEELKSLAREPLWKVVQSHPSAAIFPQGESMAQMQARAVAGLRA